MKNLLVLFLVLFISINCCTQLIAQDLSKLSQKKREQCLIDTAKLTISRFGDERYNKACYGKPKIEKLIVTHPEDSDYGKKFYRVTFYSDTTKLIFENGYVAWVQIWESTGKGFSVGYGNGFAIGLLDEQLQKEKEGIKINKMGFEAYTKEERDHEIQRVKKMMKDVNKQQDSLRRKGMEEDNKVKK